MRQRLLTAAVLIPIAYAALYMGSPFSVILGLFVYWALQFEYSRFAVPIRRRYQNAYFLLVAFLPLGLLVEGAIGFLTFFAAAVMLITSGIVLIIERESDPAPMHALLSAALVGLCYLGTLGSLLVFALSYLSPMLCIWVVVVVAIGDSAAYFGGMAFGERKLSTRISPKKTIAGLLSGCIGSLLVGVALGLYLFPDVRPIVLALIAFILSMSAVFGDLSESLLKRAYDVKDSGSLLPGHGGVLDRVDALLFAAPTMLLLAECTGVR